MTISVETILNEAKKRMHSSLETLKKDISTIRTGRANTGILDTIQLEYYGSIVPLNQIACISVPEASTLLITPFDKNSIKSIEIAILKSELGLNPTNDGTVIRLPIPPLNEERRKSLVKMIGRIGEDIKTAIRNIRRDTNEDIKKMKKSKDAPLSEDTAKKNLEIIQKITDEVIKEIDEIIKHKEDDIMRF